jgi:hypothetical protein
MATAGGDMTEAAVLPWGCGRKCVLGDECRVPQGHRCAKIPFGADSPWGEKWHTCAGVSRHRDRWRRAEQERERDPPRTWP